MARYAYVNGRYVPHGEAAIHVEDRGFQFADGVYEVVTVQEGRMVDEKGHVERLQRSLDELKMDAPMGRRALGLVMRELVRKNGVRNGIVYLQITRGVAPRDFKFPTDVAPTLVMTTRHMDLDQKAVVEKGVSVITVPEIRWKRRDIKSVSLLPQVLGKQMAAEAGASEAWQVEEDGKITEGCSSNAWIITADDVIVTRKASNSILNGITRQSILKLSGGSDLKFEERAFTVEEAYAAREAFLSSATTYVMPITRIDGRAVGDGKPGPIALKLRKAYQDYAVGAGATA